MSSLELSLAGVIILGTFNALGSDSKLMMDGWLDKWFGDTYVFCEGVLIGVWPVRVFLNVGEWWGSWIWKLRVRRGLRWLGDIGVDGNGGINN